MAKAHIRGMAEVIATIRNLPEVVREGARKGCLEVAESIRGQAVDIAKKPSIKAGLYAQDASNNEIVRASVAIDMGREPQALFEEMGTGQVANEQPTYNGLEKTPLPNSAYRPTPWIWYDESGKHTASGKPGYVYTRGRRARPYLYPAAQLEEPYASKKIQDAIERELKKQGGG